MSTRIPVGSSYTSAAFWAPAVAGLVLCGIGAGNADNPTGSLVLLSAGGACLLAAAVSAGMIFMKRRWVEARPDGFTVVDRGGSREFRDEQVARIALEVKNVYASGLLDGVDRRVRLWVEDGTGGAPIELRQRVKRLAVDPVGEMLDRILGKLEARAKEDLAAGRSLEGERWELKAEELVVRRGREPETLRVAEMSAAGLFDGALRVWRKGEEEAWAVIPSGSAGAVILGRLLQEMIPKETEGEAREGDLGRVLFERRPGKLGVGLLWCLGGLVVLIGALIGTVEGPLAGMAGLAPGAAILFGAWVVRGSVFRCLERGVMKRGRFGTRQFRYAEVGSFTYGATRVFVHGAYSHTKFILRFAPRPGVEGKPIGYSTSLQGADEELDRLRDHISKVIASQMGEELAAGRAVAWTERLTIRPDAIEHRPSGWFGRKEPVVIPFGEVTGFTMELGFFHLFVRGKEKSVVQEASSQPNFYPGYFLLHGLFRPAEPGK